MAWVKDTANARFGFSRPSYTFIHTLRSLESLIGANLQFLVAKSNILSSHSPSNTCPLWWGHTIAVTRHLSLECAHMFTLEVQLVITLLIHQTTYTIRNEIWSFMYVLIPPLEIFYIHIYMYNFSLKTSEPTTFHSSANSTSYLSAQMEGLGRPFALSSSPCDTFLNHDSTSESVQSSQHASRIGGWLQSDASISDGRLVAVTPRACLIRWQANVVCK